MTKKGILILNIKTLLKVSGVTTRLEQSMLVRYVKNPTIFLVEIHNNVFPLYQILTLLTLEELMLTLPKKLIRPRTVLIKPGMTYFLAGLGRIDYVDGPHSLL